MPTHVLRERATAAQMVDMRAEWGAMIKVVVDVRREIMAGGGEMHADAEATLLRDGSEQEDLWGANYYLDTGQIRYEALINIRPRQGNLRMQLQDETLRAKMERVIRRLLEGREG
jgi:hypothetical protein